MGSARDAEENVVEVSALEFAYGGQAPFISKFSLKLKPRSPCLLIGANRAGKATLLRILAGKHMVGGRNVIPFLGRSDFMIPLSHGRVSWLTGADLAAELSVVRGERRPGKTSPLD